MNRLLVLISLPLIFACKASNNDSELFNCYVDALGDHWQVIAREGEIAFNMEVQYGSAPSSPMDSTHGQSFTALWDNNIWYFTKVEDDIDVYVNSKYMGKCLPDIPTPTKGLNEDHI